MSKYRRRLGTRRTIEDDFTYADINVEDLPDIEKEEWTLPDGKDLDAIIDKYIYSPYDVMILNMVRIGKSKYDISRMMNIPRQTIDARTGVLCNILRAAWRVEELLYQYSNAKLTKFERRVWRLFELGVPIRRMAESFDIPYGGNSKVTMYGTVTQIKKKLISYGAEDYVKAVETLRRYRMTGLKRD